MIEELLQKTAQSLDNANIPYMIIGGQAVLIYGTPRLTRDIDIEDVKNVLIKNKHSIDFKYIENWLYEFNKIPEYDGLLNKFKKLYKE